MLGVGQPDRALDQDLPVGPSPHVHQQVGDQLPARLVHPDRVRPTLIDHNVALILHVCDRIQVLDQGRTLAEGTPDEIRKNIDVANAYLGGSGRDV